MASALGFSSSFVACDAAEEHRSPTAPASSDLAPQVSVESANEIGSEISVNSSVVRPHRRGSNSGQKINVTYWAELKDGIVVKRGEQPIPDSAFKVAPDTLEKPPAELPTDPPKISEELRRVLNSSSEADLEKKEQVVVTFSQDLKIPRFPDPFEEEVKDSMKNQAVLAEAQRLVEEVKQARQVQYDIRAAELSKAFGAVERERFWLIDGMTLELPLGAVEALSKRADVQYIELEQTTDEPPFAGDDIVDGRAVISSDHLYSFTGNWIGLLDTGLRTTHTLFNNPKRWTWVRDCVNGTSNYCSTGSNLNPDDDYWNHGTRTASILSGNSNLGNTSRGVTPVLIDSWKVYNSNGYQSAAGVRAFEAAVFASDRVIVAEIQSTTSAWSSTSTAADAAFDAGSVVVAAAGNYGSAAFTIASPGNAHKVLSIGAVDVQGLNLKGYSGRGPAGDDRIKPDLLAPTDTRAASTSGNTALAVYGGTSGATPYGAGSATLVRNFLRGSNTTIDPGQVYAYMLMAGEGPGFNNDFGAGIIDIPVNAGVWFGATYVGEGGDIDIEYNIGTPTQEVKAAIWWPESHWVHNDIDLWLIRPDGSNADWSTSVASVFEKTNTTSNLQSGTWKFRIRGHSVTGTQLVYYAMYRK